MPTASGVRQESTGTSVEAGGTVRLEDGDDRLAACGLSYVIEGEDDGADKVPRLATSPPLATTYNVSSLSFLSIVSPHRPLSQNSCTAGVGELVSGARGGIVITAAVLCLTGPVHSR